MEGKRLRYVDLVAEDAAAGLEVRYRSGNQPVIGGIGDQVKRLERCSAKQVPVFVAKHYGAEGVHTLGHYARLSDRERYLSSVGYSE